MNLFYNIIRLFVSLLFIFSGLIKANDPLGLSYKIQEYFEIWNLHALNSFSLPLAVLLNTAEIGLGVALFLNWKTKITHFSLLVLLLFFTGLTGYTYWTGFPKNCGCFGDCLPLSSFQSFLKDLMLLAFLSFLIAFPRFNKKAVSYPFKGFYCLLAVILVLSFQYYTLHHLPIIDCLPYKVGADLNENRKVPATAIPDSTVIIFTYKQGNKVVRFPASQFPADFSSQTYQYISREDKVIRAGKDMDPPIKGFVLSGETGIDSTNYILQLPAALLVITEQASALNRSLSSFEKLPAKINNNPIPVYVVTAQPTQVKQILSKTKYNGWPVFSCDLKAIQTAARTDPTIYYLEKGVVIRKKAANDF
jgi:uncharacterized membrane protein YphA (DoxX/SURF4 family)